LCPMISTFEFSGIQEDVNQVLDTGCHPARIVAHRIYQCDGPKCKETFDPDKMGKPLVGNMNACAGGYGSELYLKKRVSNDFF